ncbi:MAG: DMT family transporter [Patescibacteria group bacterium]|nr:DMT family transporter [Patescibacteria group bacterium]
MKKSRLAIAALVITSIVWGITIIVLKLVLKEVPPFSLAFLRFSLASLMISPIFIFDGVHHPLHLKDTPKLFLLGLVGVTIHLSLIFFGVKNTTATNAAIITALTPLGVATAASSFLKETNSPNYYSGSLIALLGILAIFGAEPLFNSANFSPIHHLGNLLILGSVLTWSIFNIGSKELFKKYNSFTITAFLFLTGMVTFAPLAFLEYQANPTWTSHVSDQSILGIIFLALFSSVVAYLLYEWGLEHVRTSTAGLINYLTPVVTIISAVFILGETITLPFLLGSILIMCGLTLAIRPSSNHIHHSHKV